MKKVIILAIVVVFFASFVSAEIVRGINIDFVSIGNAGNVADSTGYGAVGYVYRIGKYEVTNAQWNAFLAAAGATGSNPSYWTGTQQPTDSVSWYEAAQFCNYLTSGNKSLGAYQFGTDGSITVYRAAAISTYGTIYVIPTEDEWYKAAYFKPDGSGYSLYANGTNTAPSTSQACYNIYVSSWDVGTGTMEQNGTFDMMGNLWEWNETLLYGSYGGLRGGSHNYDGDYAVNLSSSTRGDYYVYSEDSYVGFRVASISSDSNSEVVIINSGVDAATFINASFGGGGFDHVFTSDDFSAARNGSVAHIVPPENTGMPWVPNGSTSPTALWINCSATNSPDASALYAIPFTLTKTENVKLDFYYAIDDSLGDPINSGLFINGAAVSGTNSASQLECSPVRSLSIDITNYVVYGQNYLYIYQYDYTGWSGSQFTAVITATPKSCTSRLHVETLTIPSDGTKVYSSILKAGTQYEFNASGTYNFTLDGYKADAEWVERPGYWEELHTNAYGDILDLLINDTLCDWLGRTTPTSEFALHTFSQTDHVYMLPWSGNGQSVSFSIKDTDYYWDNSGFLTVDIFEVSECAIPVTVGIHPNTLNLQSKGNWITCVISFPTEVNLTDVDSNSIILNGQIAADFVEIDIQKQIVVAKFSRSAVESFLQPGTTEVTVGGTLINRKRFEGKDTITVIKKPYCLSSPPMDFNGDCKVDIKDYAIFIQSWLECNLEPKEACGQ